MVQLQTDPLSTYDLLGAEDDNNKIILILIINGQILHNAVHVLGTVIRNLHRTPSILLKNL